MEVGVQNAENSRKGKYLKKYKIEDLKEKAKQFRGELLNEEYISIHYKYTWKCVNGHIFEKAWNKLLYSNQWCPYCNNKNTKETMYKFFSS